MQGLKMLTDLYFKVNTKGTPRDLSSSYLFELVPGPPMGPGSARSRCILHCAFPKLNYFRWSSLLWCRQHLSHLKRWRVPSTGLTMQSRKRVIWNSHQIRFVTIWYFRAISSKLVHRGHKTTLSKQRAKDSPIHSVQDHTGLLRSFQIILGQGAFAMRERRTEWRIYWVASQLLSLDFLFTLEWRSYYLSSHL
jgi:hypothetical protein